MRQHIVCERGADSHIGRIVIQRPEKSNAFSMEMVVAFREALSALASDDGIKVIVIAPAGWVLCGWTRLARPCRSAPLRRDRSRA